jgi:hypothetical protein
MAKQIAGLCRLEGTFGNATFYKMEGKYYARKKSRLTAEKVKTHPDFECTMIYAGLLGRASKIGSVIYQQLPENWRQFWMYRSFTGEAMKMLEGGATEQEAKDYLWKTYVEYWELLKAAGDWEKKGLRVAGKKKPSLRAGWKKQPKGSPRRNYKRPQWIDVEEVERKKLAYEKKKAWCKQQWQKEKQDKALRAKVRLSGCPEIRKLLFDMREVVYLNQIAIAS